MENPAVIATQFTPPPAASPPCANAGTAKLSTDNAMNRLLSLRMLLSPHMNCRQWVVDVILVQTPSR
jgi:hypothetical protein